MTNTECRKRIMEIGIVPVVRASSPKQALQAAEAVCAGGIPIVEVTMTVPGAIEVIAELAKTKENQVLIGAGTVLDAATAERCVHAGAKFLVTPGFDLETVQLAKTLGVTIMAGALTPTEVMSAWKAESDFIKIFPCGNVGSAKYIKALRGPFPQVPLVPTGGVNLSNAAEFIQAGAAALGVGGELISAVALESGHTDQISEAARQYVAIVAEARSALKSAAI
ncbi:MAG: bifunctional 4-hydroxy-2-oxoglutarate aldolase/2-dehydro-3-deoxy-phosphogluconate aldolase [Acidobacteriales bacterium]|nr:bifunctional 4-hydroxy-2-oxoglutarate aldolase/2-dehydro-3-deoxy-phosphogluconate aldolase [Terriglobales bacterium]